MLTAADILAIHDAKIESVYVPEWKQTAYVRVMSGTSRDAWEGECLAAREAKVQLSNLRGRLLVRVLCNEQGALLFTADQAEALGGKSATALNALFEASTRLNGMGGEAQKSVGEDSDAAPSDVSGSASL